MGRGDFYAEARAPELMEAVTVNTPANANADLKVTIPSFGADMPPFGPVIWSPHGTHMPPAGTLCLVAKVGPNVWVLQWQGTWT